MASKRTRKKASGKGAREVRTRKRSANSPTVAAKRKPAAKKPAPARTKKGVAPKARKAKGAAPASKKTQTGRRGVRSRGGRNDRKAEPTPVTSSRKTRKPRLAAPKNVPTAKLATPGRPGRSRKPAFSDAVHVIPQKLSGSDAPAPPPPRTAPSNVIPFRPPPAPAPAAPASKKGRKPKTERPQKRSTRADVIPILSPKAAFEALGERLNAAAARFEEFASKTLPATLPALPPAPPRRKGGRRDHSAEYRRRIARLTSQGASVAQARGHARRKKDELPLRDLRTLITGLGDDVTTYRKMYTDLHKEMQMDGKGKLAGWAEYFRSWGLQARQAYRLFWSPKLVSLAA